MAQINADADVLSQNFGTKNIIISIVKYRMFISAAAQSSSQCDTVLTSRITAGIAVQAFSTVDRHDVNQSLMQLSSVKGVLVY